METCEVEGEAEMKAGVFTHTHTRRQHVLRLPFNPLSSLPASTFLPLYKCTRLYKIGFPFLEPL